MMEYGKTVSDCAAGSECSCGGAFTDQDDIRLWQCGCYGHKDCFKDGLLCQIHQKHPFTKEEEPG